MAIAFSYDEANNKVVVTGGTEGTPATFADFVTADRAGTAELLAAEACGVNHVLTYQVRPVEDLAIQINFILSGTSAGAGDTLDITGTDWEGNAQNESIDVSGGDGTYNGSKKWRTITDIDCTGWADGTLQVTQSRWGVIWDYGTSQYKIDADFYVGDGSTSTYFQSQKEMIYFTDEIRFDIRDNATLQLGKLQGDYAIDGSYWRLKLSGTTIYRRSTSTVLKIYGSNLVNEVQGDLQFHSEIIDIRNSIIGGTDPTSWGSAFAVKECDSLILDKVYFYCDTLQLFVVPDTFNDVHTHYSNLGVYGRANGIEADGALITSSVDNDFGLDVGSGTFYLLDPGVIPTSCRPVREGDEGIVRYSCNIHIADKDGNDIENATILCEDKDGNEVFSVSTDANGNIVEQKINYKSWLNEGDRDNPTETVYSPHTFTISKTGYETIVLDTITVDDKIVWHLELLPELAEADVRDETAFGEDKIGSLDLPAVGDVEKGVDFDGLTKTGTFKKPAVDDVRDGEQYGANDVEFEGNLELPAEEDVESGVGYGAEGSEFEGTLIPSYVGQDLIGVLEKSVELTGEIES